MEDKKHMCKDGTCGGCDGWSDYHLAGHGRHDLARMLLSICILLFVFWLGLAVGELKAYLRAGRLDGYGFPMMIDWNTYPSMMRRQSASETVQSPVPSPLKKGSSANY